MDLLQFTSGQSANICINNDKCIMKIRNTTPTDLRFLLHWVTDKKSCKLWAGPYVHFPFTLETLMQDIGYTEDNTYSLVTEMDDLIGIGQILEKGNTLHLARIIIAPEKRKKGFGHILCRHLIQYGIRKFGNKDFSLNVYKSNKVAIKVYTNLGFTPVSRTDEFKSKDDSVYMLLRSQALNSTL